MKVPSIPCFSQKTAQKTRERLDSLAKVPGSLGKLEELVIRLAGITDVECPSFPQKGVVLFAGDHDIALKGVSATGQEVTTIQVRNFCRGGGTINAFCRSTGTRFTAVDVGMKDDVDVPGLVHCKVVHAARDFSEGPAMTREEAEACIAVGVDQALAQAAQGATLLAAGEMGIGNTSPSTAITSVLTGMSVEKATGIGSVIPQERLSRKVQLIKQGIELNKPDPMDPLDVLAKVGGPEIGAMAGFMLGGASQRIPVVIDGFIAGAAAAIAVGLCPRVRDMLIGSHMSHEPGHAALMEYVNVPTYFDFGMRLGEGTGAVLLFPLIDAAVRILTEMPTLKELEIWR